MSETVIEAAETPRWSAGQTVVLIEADASRSLRTVERTTPKGFAVIGDRLFRADGYERVDGILLRNRAMIRSADAEDIRELTPRAGLWGRIRRAFGL